jgi:hypothetical protein
MVLSWSSSTYCRAPFAGSTTSTERVPRQHRDMSGLHQCSSVDGVSLCVVRYLDCITFVRTLYSQFSTFSGTLVMLKVSWCPSGDHNLNGTWSPSRLGDISSKLSRPIIPRLSPNAKSQRCVETCIVGCSNGNGSHRWGKVRWCSIIVSLCTCSVHCSCRAIRYGTTKVIVFLVTASTSVWLENVARRNNASMLYKRHPGYQNSLCTQC